MGFTAPSSASSPPKSQGARASSGTICAARPARPTAMGSSKVAPSFFKSAGARFTVMRFCGSMKPQFFSADTTRTLDSFTAPSGSPTTLKNGMPSDMSTSTSTTTASTPNNAPDLARASTLRLLWPRPKQATGHGLF